MRSPRIFRLVSTNTVARGCGLILALASSFVAGAEGEELDEEALRADARETFKNKVGPFVKTYCTKCHGGRGHGVCFLGFGAKTRPLLDEGS